MAIWNITGVWAGEYSYYPDPARTRPLSSVGFTLDARRGWFGRFAGTIEDDPRSGVPGRARIAGRVSGVRVTFSKRYPTWYLLHEDRHITIAEHLEAAYGVALDEALPAPPILYRGRYDPALQIVMGEWRIEASRIRFHSQGRTLQITTAGSSGTWSMRRQPGGYYS